MPALNELDALFSVYTENEAAFDQKLTNSIGDSDYWSTSEYKDFFYVEYISFGGVFKDFNPKDNTYRVRCILAF